MLNFSKFDRKWSVVHMKSYNTNDMILTFLESLIKLLILIWYYIFEYTNDMKCCIIDETNIFEYIYKK